MHIELSSLTQWIMSTTDNFTTVFAGCPYITAKLIGSREKTHVASNKIDRKMVAKVWVIWTPIPGRQDRCMLHNLIWYKRMKKIVDYPYLWVFYTIISIFCESCSRYIHTTWHLHNIPSIFIFMCFVVLFQISKCFDIPSLSKYWREWEFIIVARVHCMQVLITSHIVLVDQEVN